MKQFYIYLLNAIFVSILDLIDSAFGNSISIDSICVLSALTIAQWTINIICRIGEYAYGIKIKNEGECLFLTIIASITCGLITILFRNEIPKLWNLTDRQNELLSLCLLYYGLFSVINRIRGFIDAYMTLNCKNKYIVTGNVLFYALMIITDAIVIFTGGECYHLIIMTGVSSLLTVVCYLVFCDAAKLIKKPDIKEALKISMQAKDLLIDRILGKISTVTFSICASYLGTDLFAIHSVAYSIATSTEEITYCIYTNQLVHLHKFNDIKEKYKELITTAKKMFIPVILSVYLVAILLIIPIKGNLKFEQVIGFVIMYATQCILIQIYENYKGFLTSCQATKILRYGGLVGVFIRVPIALMGAFTPVGIYAFAFGSGIDFLFRGLYYRHKSLQLLSTPTISA